MVALLKLAVMSDSCGSIVDDGGLRANDHA